IVVPVNSNRPNRAPMNSSGAAIQGVRPSDSGPPMAKPTNPAARRRASGSSGDPDHNWRRPRTDRAIRLAPRISRGRASGLGSVRISVTATAAVTIGRARTPAPMKVRNSVSTHAPTGRAASNHELAATTTERASNSSAIPSRRCLGSMSRARPIDRAAPPVPLAAISQAARTRPPQVTPAAPSNDRLRRWAGLGAGPARPRRAPPRGLALELALKLAFDLALDLLVRVPERAAVLLAMPARVVAPASPTPPATLVTASWMDHMTGRPPECVSRVDAGDLDNRSRARHPPRCPRRPQHARRRRRHPDRQARIG